METIQTTLSALQQARDTVEHAIAVHKEMLEVLREAKSCATDEALYRKIDAAIAKAEGRQTFRARPQVSC
jgi:hypothetical protein